MKNKFLSIVLVIFILLSIIQVSASALTSGTCGDNLVWNYDLSTYTLTISGVGAMDDYYPDDINEIYPPWKSYVNQIQTIIISDGVTAIGSNAFQNCGNTISLIIPDSVNEIGEKAFNNCKSLKSVVIPDSVTTIGPGAFSGCNKLTSITIPDSVTSIGSAAFSGTGWYNNGKNWEDDVLYINNHLISAKENLSGTYIIKTGTKTIGGDAFSLCRSLVGVVIPDSIITIGESAFNNCWALGSVTFGNGVVSIGDYAFFNCDNLSDITIPEGVEYIGSRAFDSCDGIARISIPASVKSIGSDMVNHCNKLAFIDVNSNNEYYSNDEHGVLFNKDKTLLIEYPKNNSQKEYTIPDSVIEIGKHSFYPCENVRNVTFGDGVKIIGEAAFAYCNGFIEVIIPEGITTIGSQAFYGCSSLANVVVGDGVESIGSEAFSDSDLYSITIPGSIRTIGYRAFDGCEKLTEVYYGGSPKKWTQIEIARNNDCLLNAELICTDHDHEGGEWIIDMDSTCTQVGSQHKDCIICGVVAETAEIPLKEHIAGEWITGSESTVYKAGSKHTVCIQCGAVVETKEIPQLKCSKPKLKSVENTEYGILIKWSKVKGGDSYRVYRKTSKSDWKYIASTKNRYFTDKTAKSGTKYYYAVKARNEAGNTALSSSLSKYYLEDPTLKKPSSSSKGIALKWTQSDGAQGYRIYRKEAGGSYERIKTEKGETNLSYRDTTAKKGTKYYYKVKAYYSKTYSAYSKTKTITA